MASDRILIVDDNTVNSELMADTLSLDGYITAVASDAEEALSILDSFLPRLIIMDIQLPKMDGLTLTRQLKADPKTADICIVAVTAYAMPGDEARALASGCDGYISKPISTRTFGEQIGQYIVGAS